MNRLGIGLVQIRDERPDVEPERAIERALHAHRQGARVAVSGGGERRDRGCVRRLGIEAAQRHARAGLDGTVGGGARLDEGAKIHTASMDTRDRVDKGRLP